MTGQFYDKPQFQNNFSGTLHHENYDWWGSYYTTTVKNIIYSLQPHKRTLTNIMKAYGFQQLNAETIKFTTVDYVNFAWKPFLRDVTGLTGVITAPGFTYGLEIDALIDSLNANIKTVTAQITQTQFDLAAQAQKVDTANFPLVDSQAKINLSQTQLDEANERQAYLNSVIQSFQNNQIDNANLNTSFTSETIESELTFIAAQIARITARISELNIIYQNAQEASQNANNGLVAIQTKLDTQNAQLATFEQELAQAQLDKETADPKGYSSEFIKFIIKIFLIHYLETEVGYKDYDSWLAKVNNFFSLNLGILYKGYMNLVNSPDFGTVGSTTSQGGNQSMMTSTGKNSGLSDNENQDNNFSLGQNQGSNRDANAQATLPQSELNMDLTNLDFADAASKDNGDNLGASANNGRDVSSGQSTNESTNISNSNNQSITGSSSQNHALDVLQVWQAMPETMAVLKNFLDSAYTEYRLFLGVKMLK